jgi:hypothetical protein
MEAWSESSYRAVGIYIGGTNMACAQPNLTASWVNAESAAGWHLIPTYVGLQAPSNGCSCAAINSGRESAEGAAAAGDAVKRALAIGIGPGNPIYFDMENYSRGGGNTSAVLTFLAAWTAGLHAAGYQSGVYSNAFGGLGDLVAARGTGFTEPDDIWIADWNGQRTVSSPYVPSGEWSNHRIHQYDGGHNETHGGVTINIDGDFLDGATATSSAAAAAAAFPDGTYLQVEGSEAIYEVVGGAPLFVSPEYWRTLSAPKLTPISQQQFALLDKVPVDGTLVQDSTGALYRVAGGAPLLVSNPSLFEGIQPVQIDHWNIANAGNPAAHLKQPRRTPERFSGERHVPEDDDRRHLSGRRRRSVRDQQLGAARRLPAIGDDRSVGPLEPLQSGGPPQRHAAQRHGGRGTALAHLLGVRRRNSQAGLHALSGRAGERQRTRGVFGDPVCRAPPSEPDAASGKGRTAASGLWPGEGRPARAPVDRVARHHPGCAAAKYTHSGLRSRRHPRLIRVKPCVKPGHGR